MLHFNEEQLKQVQELAGLLFSPREIALIMEVDASELRAELLDETCEISRRYHSGRLTAHQSIRKALIQDAESGDAAAREAAFDLMKRQDESLASDM